MDDEWINTGQHSRCPKCFSVEHLKVRQVFKAATEPYSLAGVQDKTQGTWGWVYRCFNCGDTGPCDLKTLAQQGKWIDGLGNEPYE